MRNRSRELGTRPQMSNLQASLSIDTAQHHSHRKREAVLILVLHSAVEIGSYSAESTHLAEAEAVSRNGSIPAALDTLRTAVIDAYRAPRTISCVWLPFPVDPFNLGICSGVD